MVLYVYYETISNIKSVKVFFTVSYKVKHGCFSVEGTDYLT